MRKELKLLDGRGGYSKYSSKSYSDEDAGAKPIDRSAVLMVNCDGGAATAFVGKIGGKTYLISNLHVLREMKNARITTLDGREIRLPKTCFPEKGFDVFLAELDSVPNGVAPFDVSGNVMADSELEDGLVVCGNSQGGNVMRDVEGKLLAVGPKLIETDCNFYRGDSGSPIIHRESGKVIGVVSYIMTISDELSSKISRTSKAKNFSMRFFAYRLDTMKNKREIPYETVVDTMETLNCYEKKLECIVDFIGDLKRPPASEYPELAGIAASYESATEDAKRLSNSRAAEKRVNEAKRMLLSGLELLAAAEAMKLKSVKVDEVFGEKYANLSKGYRDLKIYCNKRGKDF